MLRVKQFECHFGVRFAERVKNSVSAEVDGVELWAHPIGVLLIGMSKQFGHQEIITPYTHCTRIEIYPDQVQTSLSILPDLATISSLRKNSK